MDETKKRKASSSTALPSKKNKKQRFSKKQQFIEPGDIGIWATCARGKEGKSTIDLRDLFDTYASRIYPETAEVEGDESQDDIEASISAEVSAIKSKPEDTNSLFLPIKLDTPCVLFFKTQAPIEPVAFVTKICQDKAAGAALGGCRFVKRLSPMMRMEKATEEGLETACQAVLTEATLGSRDSGIKFAIRPTFRDHNVLKRDALIKQVARAVGDGYAVDLKKPDKVILVDVYRGVLGIAVVGSEYLDLKSFNLAEIPPAGGSSPGPRTSSE